ncbi:unnamed protein product [Parajaminaea phylloscopi]
MSVAEFRYIDRKPRRREISGVSTSGLSVWTGRASRSAGENPGQDASPDRRHSETNTLRDETKNTQPSGESRILEKRPTCKVTVRSMIRRPPTAIAVTSADVEDLKAFRLQQRQHQEHQQKEQQQQQGQTEQRSVGTGAPISSQGPDSMVQDERAAADAAEHPADRAARARRERSAAERIGL